MLELLRGLRGEVFYFPRGCTEQEVTLDDKKEQSVAVVLQPPPAGFFPFEPPSQIVLAVLVCGEDVSNLDSVQVK